MYYKCFLTLACVCGGGLEVGFVSACSWLALVTGVGGYVLAGVEKTVFSFEKSKRCDDNQQITVSHFSKHKRLHLESSKQNYYIFSSRTIIKAIFTSHLSTKRVLRKEPFLGTGSIY